VTVISFSKKSEPAVIEAQFELKVAWFNASAGVVVMVRIEPGAGELAMLVTAVDDVSSTPTTLVSKPFWPANSHRHGMDE
jgi:hypothetical protein